MKLNFVLGKSGKGKTSYCIDEMLKAPLSKRIIYIVPEQFTLESEKKLTALRKSLINIDVVSFNRLRFHMAAETGSIRKEFLDDESKRMILRRLICGLSLKSLNISADKPGAIERIDSVISEFYRFGISCDILRRKLDEIEAENKGFGEKMRDILAIYESYDSFISEKYISSDQILDYVAEKIKDSSLFDGSFVYIDGFNSFTAQEYRVISEILAYAEQTTVTLCMEKAVEKSEGDVLLDPFYETKKAYVRILGIFRELFPKEGRVKNIYPDFVPAKKEALRHMEREFFELTPRKYKAPSPEINIISGVNMRAEVSAVCNDICRLAENGVRYREMAVILCDPSYLPVFRNELKKRDIPDFTDGRTPVVSHPCAVFMLSLVNMLAYNLSSEYVFGFLKTELTDISRDDIMQLEKYALARGIDGYRWGYEFKDRHMESIRKKLMYIIEPMYESFAPSKEYTVSDINRKVFEVIDRAKFYKKYSPLTNDKGDRVLASRYKQVWEQVVSTFDKMEEFLGDQQVTLEEYAEILKTGFAGKSVATIPLYGDNIIIGDIERSRLPEIKAMFVLGAVRGSLPRKFDDDGLINDSERELMKEKGMELAAGSDELLSLEYLKIYQIMTKSSEYITISFPIGNNSGEKLEKSEIVEKIENMFNIETTVYGEEVNTPSRSDPFLPDEYLSEDLTKIIFGNETTLSSSRLDRYIKCPFSYFLKYILKLKEEKAFEINSLDKGNIMHGIMENFFRKTDGDYELSDEEIVRLVDEIMPEVLKENIPDIFGDENKLPENMLKLKYFCRVMEKTACTSLKAGIDQLKRGSFMPTEYEVSFGSKSEDMFPAIDLGSSIKLEGKIDRVDLYEKDNNIYVKITDYKSSVQTIDFTEIYNGLKLQMILYLKAYISERQKREGVGKKVSPSGLMYFTFRNPMTDEDKTGIDKAKEFIANSFRPVGIISNDKENIAALENNGDKSYFKNLECVSEDKLNSIMDTGIKTAEKIGQDIRSGKIPVLPYEYKAQHGCDYCPYSGICKIDIDKSRKRVLKKEEEQPVSDSIIKDKASQTM